MTLGELTRGKAAFGQIDRTERSHRSDHLAARFRLRVHLIIRCAEEAQWARWVSPTLQKLLRSSTTRNGRRHSGAGNQKGEPHSAGFCQVGL